MLGGTLVTVLPPVVDELRLLLLTTRDVVDGTNVELGRDDEDDDDDETTAPTPTQYEYPAQKLVPQSSVTSGFQA